MRREADIGAREVLLMTRNTSTIRRSRRSVSLMTLALGVGVLGGCGFEPFAPTDMEYSMAAANHMQLDRSFENDLGLSQDSADGARAQILGALEMLVGTPQAPRYLVTEGMYDNEFDPNVPHLTEHSEELMALIHEENRARRFEDQIRLIEAGRFADVPKPVYADDLWIKWENKYLPALLEDPDAPQYEDDPDFTWKDAALALFEEHYPTLRESAEMYRVQCLHCHGVSGGGDGPTGQYLNPRPRDYRLGYFKWLKVGWNQRPRRADLHTILEYGVPRTAMPSFARFSRGELEGLIDYVRLLSIRGEVEGLLTAEILNTDYGDMPTASPIENYDRIWSRWDEAEGNYNHFEGGEVPRPEEMTAERVALGKDLFHSELAACSTCHGENARGDGESSREPIEMPVEGGEDGATETVIRKKLDAWGEYLEKGKGELLTAEEAEPYASNPRNLQLGNYRGGGRPVDIYRRIKHGIGGTIMPAASAELADDDIWNIVYYVRSIQAKHDPANYQKRPADDGHADDEGHAGDGDHEESEGH